MSLRGFISVFLGVSLWVVTSTHASPTSTPSIYVIDRDVSGATDTSEAIAAKRAIEQAARHVGVRLIPELAELWHTTR